MEFELAGGKFVKRKNDATGAESATRTRRSWTVAVDLTGAAEPTVEWVDVTERDETEVEAAKREERLRRRTAKAAKRGESFRERGERGLKDDNASSSTKTRVRLAYRSPLKLAGLHPVIRALEMGRRRRFVDDRASVEVGARGRPRRTDVNGNHRVPVYQKRDDANDTRSTFWTRASPLRRARRFCGSRLGGARHARSRPERVRKQPTR